MELVLCALEHIDRNALTMEYITRNPRLCSIGVRTDASTLFGVGGYINKGGNSQYFNQMWNELDNYDIHNKPDIIFEEMLGVVLAAKLYGHLWSGSSVRFECDNQTVVYCLIKRCACFARKDLNMLIREFLKIVIKYKFKWWIDHIKGTKNKVADALSRAKEVNIGDLGLNEQINKTDCKSQTIELMNIWYINTERLSPET